MVNYFKLVGWLLFGRKKGNMLNPGDPAPDFSISDETGAVRTLAEFQGKSFILWFYPKADTPG